MGTTMLSKKNLTKELNSVQDIWSQKTVCEANGQLIKVAKGTGETKWHKHDDQDELFLVKKGMLRIDMENSSVELGPDDVYVVPRSKMHRPVAPDYAEFVIMGLTTTSTPEGGKPYYDPSKY